MPRPGIVMGVDGDEPGMEVGLVMLSGGGDDISNQVGGWIIAPDYRAFHLDLFLSKPRAANNIQINAWIK